LLLAIGPYFKARAKRQYPQRSCPSEQRRKTAQALAAQGVALEQCRELRWLLSYSPLRGCTFEAALPAEAAEGNNGGWRAGERPFFSATKTTLI